MRKLIYTGACALLLAAANSFAACNTDDVSGNINGATWTLAGSPYCISDDVTVFDLTIEPGVRVQFKGDFAFDVIGTLNAVGTENAPILFRNDSSNTTGWEGILLDNIPPGSQIIHVKVEDALNSGMRILDSTPTIEHLSVVNNEGVNGGGLYIELTSTTRELVLKDCLVDNNTSSSHGGGIYAIVSSAAMMIDGCKINNNTANPTNASGNRGGGGIYFESAAGGVFCKNCEVTTNRTKSYGKYNAYSYGAGIYLLDGVIELEASKIDSNTAQSSSYYDYDYSYGGGIYVNSGAVSLVNSILSHNAVFSPQGQSREYGGGLYVLSGTASLINSDAVYNVPGGLYNGGGIVEADNSIIFFNDAAQIVGDANVNYSDVEGGWPTGDGNKDEDPLFLSPTDYHLDFASSAIDMGNNAFPGLPATDFDGGPRVLRTVDMGAFEFGGVPTNCPPDWNRWDVDCNDGIPDALTDSLLIIRYSLGLTGAALIDNAVSPDCRRCTADEIESYLGSQ